MTTEESDQDLSQYLSKSLHKQPFFKEFTEAQLALIADCGKPARFASGYYIAKEGSVADYFYIILEGQIAIELASPSKPNLILQTIGPGDLFGWSWIFPPYRWGFDARAMTEVHAFVFDGRCLRAKCEQDTALGYLFMKTFAHLMTRRLHATRLQLLDVYGGTA